MTSSRCRHERGSPCLARVMDWGGDGTVAWRRTDEGLTLWGPRAAVDREVLLHTLDLD